LNLKGYLSITAAQVCTINDQQDIARKAKGCIAGNSEGNSEKLTKSVVGHCASSSSGNLSSDLIEPPLRVLAQGLVDWRLRQERGWARTNVSG
jgi:hypothetical protein